MPDDILVKEHHVRVKGARAYVANTVGQGYLPRSVNTDGWKATQSAWQLLFPSIAVIECFLKVLDRATKKATSLF